MAENETNAKALPTDIFVTGARKGWALGTGSVIPNLIMAFVIIKILSQSGILTFIGQHCGSVMGLLGLPGEAITVLLGAYMSIGGGVGVALALFDQGVMNGHQLSIMTPAIFLMGAQIQYLGRILGVVDVSGRTYLCAVTIPPCMAVLSMIVMQFVA